MRLTTIVIVLALACEEQCAAKDTVYEIAQSIIDQTWKESEAIHGRLVKVVKILTDDINASIDSMKSSSRTAINQIQSRLDAVVDDSSIDLTPCFADAADEWESLVDTTFTEAVSCFDDLVELAANYETHYEFAWTDIDELVESAAARTANCNNVYEENADWISESEADDCSNGVVATVLADLAVQLETYDQITQSVIANIMSVHDKIASCGASSAIDSFGILLENNWSSIESCIATLQCDYDW